MTAERHNRVALWLACTSLVLWAATAAWLAARRPQGASAPAPAGARLLDQIRRDRVIRAGYVLNPPQASRDASTGALGGYYVDLIREIGRQANARVDFEETTFANMSLALQSRVQVVGGGGFVSIDRATNLAFSEPLFHLGLGYVCRKGDGRFRTEDDLRRPGMRVAFAAGSASEEYVKASLPEAIPVTLARGELAAVALEVMSGRADAGIVNQAQCLQFARDRPELSYPTQGRPFHLFASSLTLSQGDPEGLAFLNTAIRTLRTNGFLDKLERKYNPEGLFWTPLRP